MFLDQYISRPIQAVIGLMLFILFSTHVIFFINGFTAALATYPADAKGRLRCMTETDHRITFAEKCAELDSLTMFTPVLKGFSAVASKTYLTFGGFTDALWYSLKTGGTYLLFVGVLLMAVGFVMHFMMGKMLEQVTAISANSNQKSMPQQPPLLDYGGIPNYAWQQFARLTQNRNAYPPKPKRIAQWEGVDDDGSNEEINH